MSRPTTARAEIATLARLAAPLAAANAGNQLMNVVDTAIVGRLTPRELGAVGLANAVFFVITVVGLGIMMGFDPLIAQSFGARDPARARRLLWQGVWLGIPVGLVLSVIVAFSPATLVPFGVDPDVARIAASYIRLRIPGLLPMLTLFGLRAYLQAAGGRWALVLATIVANVSNLALGLLLVFGGRGLPWPLALVPAIGVRGAAINTVFSTILQLVVLAVAVRVIPSGGPVARALVPGDIRRAFSVGLPIGLHLLAEVAVFSIVGILAGRLGAPELAAHQVTLTIASLSFMISLGISTAGAVRVGYHVGARDPENTRRAGLAAFAAGAAFMSLAALVFVTAGHPIARLMTDKAEVVAVTVPLLVVAAFFQISDGTQAVGAGVLRGAGDTRFIFVANILGHYAIGLPVALILGFHYHLGIQGLWWGLCAGLTAVAAALLVRFHSLSRRPIMPLH
ncbi:MAG: MATE family efflux transporter [Acidobacteriota bacterium]